MPPQLQPDSDTLPVFEERSELDLYRDLHSLEARWKASSIGENKYRISSLMICLRLEGKKKEAVEHAIWLYGHQHSLESVANLSVAYLRVEPSESVTLLKAAIVKYGESVLLLSNLADGLLRTYASEECFHVLSRAGALAKSAEDFFRMSHTYALCGMDRKSIEALRRYAKMEGCEVSDGLSWVEFLKDRGKRLTAPVLVSIANIRRNLEARRALDALVDSDLCDDDYVRSTEPPEGWAQRLSEKIL